MIVAFLHILHIVAGQARPTYHITPDKDFMNDPQRPFYAGNGWHLYYLYNSDVNLTNVTGSGGTDWYHTTSTDLVRWVGKGVVIEKYKPSANGAYLGDIETGSAVVDTPNAAGFGQSAIVALLTQMGDGVQRQSLFYSTDSGSSFAAYSENPVMPNPSPLTEPAFRDPKVLWDKGSSRWIMLLAEEGKIGFYASHDLKSWSYLSGFFPQQDLGVLECPDMYQMDLDGDSAKRTWILAMSANGYRDSRTTGIAYWTGLWDGINFTVSIALPQWMDDGPDFYAAVTWPDALLSETQQYANRYAIAWMNNWSYAKCLPYYGGWAGQQSMTRQVQLKTIGNTATLVSLPIGGYSGIFGPAKNVSGTLITAEPSSAALPTMGGGAYRIQMAVEKNSSDSGNEFRLVIKGDGTYDTTVGYNFDNSQAFIMRERDGVRAHGMPQASQETYNALRTSSISTGPSIVTLAIYVDWNSVEIFVNGGLKVLSALIYPNIGAESIQVTTDTGTLTLLTFSYAEALQ